MGPPNRDQKFHRSRHFPAWIDIRASEVFHLDAPEMAGETRSYKALRHPGGGGRQDILEFSG